MAELEVLKQLHDTYRVITKAQEQWKHVIREANLPIQQLINLGEQYSCCANITFENTALCVFPDSKQRLLTKLVACLEEQMFKVHRNLKELREVKDEVDTSVIASLAIYTKHHKQIGMEKACEIHALRPSTAKMLEDVESVNNAFHVEYSKVHHYVTEVEYELYSSVEELGKQWRTSPQFEACVKNALAIATYFMDDFEMDKK